MCIRDRPLTRGMEAVSVGLTVGADAQLTGQSVSAGSRARWRQFDRLEACNVSLKALKKAMAWEHAREQFSGDASLTVNDLLSGGLFDGYVGMRNKGLLRSFSGQTLVLSGLPRTPSPGDTVLYRMLTMRHPITCGEHSADKFASPELFELAQVRRVLSSNHTHTSVGVGEHKGCLNGSGWDLYVVPTERLNQVRAWLRSARSGAPQPEPYRCEPVTAELQLPEHTAGEFKGREVSVVGSNLSGAVLDRELSLRVARGEQVALELTATGHGQYGALRCGEFCEIKYELRVNGQHAGWLQQRPVHCEQNPVSPQKGCWARLVRSGALALWCSDPAPASTSLPMCEAERCTECSCS
eukprot:TRINITY_DN10965_c0_g1_i2.p1 TRINITY_DN10965_c0_g1~~TRINITY_DN10965_c0_g1_i2.p1  ORF type:complete len:354 (+),score=93.03 TRINITY_DN10965_c0_g1_i2:127-1188(+)